MPLGAGCANAKVQHYMGGSVSPQGGMSWQARAVLRVRMLSFSVELSAAVSDLLSWVC